jgi:hypothetical protein
VAVNDKKRPASAKVIGWVFIFLAGYNILCGIGGFLSVSSSEDYGDRVMLFLESMENPSLGPKIIAFIIKNFGILCLFLVAFSIFCFFIGIQLLRMRHWARLAAEAASWAALFLFGVGGITWLAAIVLLMFSDYKFGDSSNFPIIAMIVFSILDLIILGIYATPIIIILKILRGKSMRALFRKERATGQ